MDMFHGLSILIVWWFFSLHLIGSCPIAILHHCSLFSYHSLLWRGYHCLLNHLPVSARGSCWVPQSHFFCRLNKPQSHSLSPLITGKCFLPDQLDSPLLSSLLFRPKSGCSIYMWFGRCWAEWDGHFPQPPEYMPVQPKMLLAPFAAKAPWCPPQIPGPFWQSCSSDSSPQPVLLPGGASGPAAELHIHPQQIS